MSAVFGEAVCSLFFVGWVYWPERTARLSLPGALGHKSLGAPSLSAGDHGFPGSSGPRGDPGFKGDKGDVGLPGKPGSMDKVDMGSMKGEKGDQGEKGILEEVHLRSGEGSHELLSSSCVMTDPPVFLRLALSRLASLLFFFPVLHRTNWSDRR